MSAFDTINYLFFQKKKTELDNELLSNFNPYLTTKSLSFYDDGVLVDYVNETLNTYSGAFKTPEDQFRFFENIIPKVKKRRINYLKKPKIEEEEPIGRVPEFYSKREWKMLTYPDD